MLANPVERRRPEMGDLRPCRCGGATGRPRGRSGRDQPRRPPFSAGLRRAPGSDAEPETGLRGSRQAERVCDRCEVVDVAVDAVQTTAHRDHRDMRTTYLAPGIDLHSEVAYATRRKRHIVRAEAVD